MSSCISSSRGVSASAQSTKYGDVPPSSSAQGASGSGSPDTASEKPGCYCCPVVEAGVLAEQNHGVFSTIEAEPFVPHADGILSRVWGFRGLGVQGFRGSGVYSLGFRGWGGLGFGVQRFGV